MGLTLMFFPILMPALIKKTSALSCYRAGTMLFCVINALLPSMRLAKAAGPDVLWICLIAFALIRSVGGVMTFIPTAIILNAMLKDARNVGFYNGLNDSLSALGKALAPTATGSLFAAMTTSQVVANASLINATANALRLQEPVFPFDEHLPFFFISSLCLVALFLSFYFYK